jgi:RNA polymerase sigma-70 factor (ECF subfamily)
LRIVPGWIGQEAREHVADAATDVDREVSDLFERWRLPIYRYLVVMLGRTGEAEEVTQETFIRLYAYLRAGHAREEARFWLFTVAHNLAVTALRQRRHLVALAQEDGWAAICEQAATQATQERHVLMGQRRRRVAEALHGLTAQERACLALRAEGLKYQEIATLLDTTYAGAADALRRAIAKLRKAVHD